MSFSRTATPVHRLKKRHNSVYSQIIQTPQYQVSLLYTVKRACFTVEADSGEDVFPLMDVIQ